MRQAMLGGGVVCALAGLASGAILVEGDSGWVNVNTVWGGKVRNITHTNGDWEMALGQSPGSFAVNRQSTWAGSGEANTFSLTYSNLTGDISLDWNGSVLNWNDADRANSLAIQLLARGRSGGDATFEVGDLAFNGEAIDLGVANPFATAGTTEGHGSASYILLGGEGFAELNEWTVSGTLTATWSGSTPSRDLSRVEFIASNDRVIPAPAGVAVLGAVAMAVAPRRRR